jgi:EmrB/QacA subfamily drug resistance transporter
MKNVLRKGAGQRSREHDWRQCCALASLCLGIFSVVVDVTALNVALPSIQQEMNLSENSLVWVVNAYTVMFGGFLLLGGRLGDIYGCRNVLLAGSALFTVTSVGCGIAHTSAILVLARAGQGLGGAMVVAGILPLIVNMFPDERAMSKAIGAYGFVCAVGGSVGVLIGGVLTSTFNWHWIFLINVPIGVVVTTLYVWLVPDVRRCVSNVLDVWGAISVTGAISLAICGLGIASSTARWMSAENVLIFGTATALLAAFVRIETHIRHPLLPFHIFRVRNLAAANAVSVLWTASTSAWLFTSVLYMQRVLGYGPMQISVAYFATNVTMAASAIVWSGTFATRFGIRMPIAVGMLLAAVSFVLFSRARPDGGLTMYGLLCMTLFGLGAGTVFNPLLRAAVSYVEPAESGLASGINNTATRLGGALGLAAIVGLTSTRTRDLAASGASMASAYVAGYQRSFLLSAACAATAGLASATLLRPSRTPRVERVLVRSGLD